MLFEGLFLNIFEYSKEIIFGYRATASMSGPQSEFTMSMFISMKNTNIKWLYKMACIED
jgi:hypothetical protein